MVSHLETQKNQIAEWLNDNNYRKVRGKSFKSGHVHSIIKKRRMTNYILDGHDLSDLFSFSTPVISFSDNYKKHVPSYGSIVYTVWDLENKFIYVGIGGTQRKPVAKRDPQSRIKEHSSGRRSGDQFCIYVHDFFVLPNIIKTGTYQPEKDISTN